MHDRNNNYKNTIATSKVTDSDERMQSRQKTFIQRWRPRRRPHPRPGFVSAYDSIRAAGERGAVGEAARVRQGCACASLPTPLLRPPVRHAQDVRRLLQFESRRNNSIFRR